MRYNQIMELVPEEAHDLLSSTVEQMVFLESQLDGLRKLPFIKIHPTNPELQKSTPASKMYKELLQQYNNCVKIVEAVIYRDKKLEGGEVEESPLRQWYKNNQND